jgi:hypothetical protein
MAQEHDDDLLFAMSLVEKPSLLEQRPAAVETNSQLAPKGDDVVTVPSPQQLPSKTTALDVQQVQELKQDTSPDWIKDVPQRIKPVVSASVDCTNNNSNHLSGKSSGKLSLSANSIFTPANKPAQRVVGFNVPSSLSSTSHKKI